MEKIISVGGKDVRMRASALIPRLYRYKFRRDMIADMRQLEKDFKKATNLPENATEEEIQDAELSILDLTIFENVAWLMIRNAGEDVPDDPDEWLDIIDGVFSVYEVLPQILDMWEANLATTSVPRKK
ncbi:MAG: hypothetical protein IKE81_09965 [Clostridia bacterium]|nr:hypothetical protein [Clostridia bacterium]